VKLGSGCTTDERSPAGPAVFGLLLVAVSLGAAAIDRREFEPAELRLLVGRDRLSHDAVQQISASVPSAVSTGVFVPSAA
jgi:hypothetical protein